MPISGLKIFRPGARHSGSSPASPSSSRQSSWASCCSRVRNTTMNPEWVHPGLVLIVGAWLLPLLGRRPRRLVMVLLPAIALVDCMLMTPGTHGQVSFLGHELVFGRVDRLSLVFSYVFALF